MVKSFNLVVDGIETRSISPVGIYEYKDKIIFVHFNGGSVSEENKNIPERCRLFPSFAIVDYFSEGFNKHHQAYLEYNEYATVSNILYPFIFSGHDALCYWLDGKFVLNTKYYEGYSAKIEKIIEISDTKLIETDLVCSPIKKIYNDSLSYTFGDYRIRMASPFVMECKSIKSNGTIWQLKLSAYLYTKLDEKDGVIYFGTAGKGGRLYGVSLKDGNVIFNYDSGGTVNFLWYKNNILLTNRKNKPILLDSKKGTEIRKIEFGKFEFISVQNMLIKGDKLYATVSDSITMYAVCADLD